MLHAARYFFPSEVALSNFMQLLLKLLSAVDFAVGSEKTPLLWIAPGLKKIEKRSEKEKAFACSAKHSLDNSSIARKAIAFLAFSLGQLH